MKLLLSLETTEHLDTECCLVTVAVMVQTRRSLMTCRHRILICRWIITEQSRQTRLRRPSQLRPVPLC